MSEAIIAAVIALVGVLAFIFGKREGSKGQARRNLKASQEARANEDHVSQLDDTSLADRISRRD